MTGLCSFIAKEAADGSDQSASIYLLASSSNTLLPPTPHNFHFPFPVLKKDKRHWAVEEQMAPAFQRPEQKDKGQLGPGGRNEKGQPAGWGWVGEWVEFGEKKEWKGEFERKSNSGECDIYMYFSLGILPTCSLKQMA